MKGNNVYWKPNLSCLFQAVEAIFKDAVNKLFIEENNHIQLLPSLGIMAFVCLFIFASTLYPGGSQADIHSKGYDWVHNYWCNLMNVEGMNGQANPARPYAILAMIILCLSLMIFFLQFAKMYTTTVLWKRIIQVCGVLSMFTATLIFTRYHDLMTMLSSVFGLFVVVGIIKEVYKSKMTVYKITGMFCICLLALNNFIYYSGQGIEALPLIQKGTFLVVLLWVVGLNCQMTRKRTLAKSSA